MQSPDWTVPQGPRQARSLCSSGRASERLSSPSEQGLGPGPLAGWPPVCPTSPCAGSSPARVSAVPGLKLPAQRLHRATWRVLVTEVSVQGFYVYIWEHADSDTRVRPALWGTGAGGRRGWKGVKWRNRVRRPSPCPLPSCFLPGHHEAFLRPGLPHPGPEWKLTVRVDAGTPKAASSCQDGETEQNLRAS